MSYIIDLTNAPTPPRWFEFLLEPGRLQQHLDSNTCDPTAIQLITLFFRNIPNLESNSLASSNQTSTSSGTSGQTGTNNSSPSQSSNQAGDVATDSCTSSTGTNSPTNNGATNITHNGSSNNNGNNYKPSLNDQQTNDKVLIDYSDSSEVTIPPDSYEAKYRLKKAYALQTLAITVASFLKWDLNILCNNLTIPIQYKLMQALSKSCSSSECPQEVKEFSTVLYCHWFLKSAITYQISTLQPQTNNTTIIYLSQLQQQQQAADTSALSSMGELFAPDSPQLKTTAQLLSNYIWDITKSKDGSGKKARGAYHPFKKAKLKRPLVGCFDSRGESLNDWSKCESIEPFEFIEAACYDLGRFFFFEESYAKAKDAFEIIKNSSSRYPMLMEYLKSSNDLIEHMDPKSGKKKSSSTTDTKMADEEMDDSDDISCDKITREIRLKRKQTEKYLFECMMRYKERQQEKKKMDSEDSEMKDNDDNELSHRDGDVDLRFQQQNQQLQRLDNNPWYLQMPASQQQQQLLEATKGDMFMSEGNYKQAMGCFVSTLMLMTDYFRFFSKNYVDEEPYISRMIQCSISLSCFTQAVALCQMTRNMNYTIALKQLNERVCHDCCDDIYECIWNVTLLEYIINLHSKRGEVERRTKVIQLIGQLELNENNPEEISREAEHVRRGRFFRILSNKYL